MLVAASSMMKGLIIVIVTLFAFADSGEITIRTKVYEEEILKEGVPNPYQLSIDHDTNTLFFSYTVKGPELFKMANLNLKTNDYGLVSGIHGGFATAVDSRSHVVYMGGEDGLYKFDYDTKAAKKLNIGRDINIWQMFYKDALYLISYLEETALIYKNESVVEIPELKGNVMEIAVRNDGSFVFSNSSGLFTYIEEKLVFVGDYIVNGFFSDVHGNIYFSTAYGIYYMNDKTHEIEELVKMKNIYGATIEANGNIIYANEDSVIRLKPTIGGCADDLTV